MAGAAAAFAEVVSHWGVTAWSKAKAEVARHSIHTAHTHSIHTHSIHTAYTAVPLLFPSTCWAVRLQSASRNVVYVVKVSSDWDPSMLYTFLKR